MTEVVDGPTSNDTVLRITRLVAGYGLRPVLSQVSLDISAGQWLALLGPNGSGKSTLLYCIAGMLKPTSGEVEICGSSLSLDAVTAKRALGFGCAPDVLPPLLTGRQCLEVHAAAKGVRQVDPEVLDLVANFKFTPFLDQFVDTYSLGTRQKLAVLLALIGAPRLIVLDEAFNGLDPAAARCLKRHLRDLVETRRASVLLATHALDVVERYADRAVLMLAGRIVRVWEPAAMAEFRNSGTLEDAIAAAADEAQPEPLY